MNIKLATINLEVADPAASSSFYRDALGMTEDAGRSHPPGFVYLRSGGADLTLARAEGPAGVGPSPTMEVGFEVDDFAAARAALERAGLDFEERSMGWGEAIELRDPDGHRLVVYKFRP